MKILFLIFLSWFFFFFTVLLLKQVLEDMNEAFNPSKEQFEIFTNPRIENHVLMPWERHYFSIISIVFTAWKVPKYPIFSGQHFPVIGLNKDKENTDQKKLHIWTLFTQWFKKLNLFLKKYVLLTCIDHDF